MTTGLHGVTAPYRVWATPRADQQGTTVLPSILIIGTALAGPLLLWAIVIRAIYYQYCGASILHAIVDNRSQLLMATAGLANLTTGLTIAVADERFQATPFALAFLAFLIVRIMQFAQARFRAAHAARALADLLVPDGHPAGTVVTGPLTGPASVIAMRLQPTSRLSRFLDRRAGRDETIATFGFGPLYLAGQFLPYRFRRLNRAWARAGRYFWLPCPLCGQPFGGHEWRDIGGLVSRVPDPLGGPGMTTAICPPCTRAGRGVEGTPPCCST